MTARPWYAARGFVASGVFLLVIIVGGVALAVTDDHSRAREAAPAVRHIRPADSVCGLAPGNQDEVVGPPAGTSWTLVGHMAAPSIPGVGPGVLDGRDRRCFAHSPVGAAVAAANALALSSLPDDSLTEGQALGHVMPGRIRDMYARQPSTPVDPAARFQIAAVRTDIGDRDNVTVALAVRMNGGGTDVPGGMASIAFHMRWFRNDWRVEPLSERQPFDIEALRSLDSFGGVEWSGA
jgi:hypothetical protein